jgi:hypothetical protein
MSNFFSTFRNFCIVFLLCSCYSLLVFFSEISTSIILGSFSVQESEFKLVELFKTFFPWRWGGSSTQPWMPAYVSILRIPQMIWVWRATVEWYWQGKTKELGEKPVPVPLCPPQIPHGLTQARTRASTTNDLSHGTAYFVPSRFDVISVPLALFPHASASFSIIQVDNSKMLKWWEYSLSSYRKALS